MSKKRKKEEEFNFHWLGFIVLGIILVFVFYLSFRGPFFSNAQQMKGTEASRYERMIGGENMEFEYGGSGDELSSGECLPNLKVTEGCVSGNCNIACDSSCKGRLCYFVHTTARVGLCYKADGSYCSENFCEGEGCPSFQCSTLCGEGAQLFEEQISISEFDGCKTVAYCKPS